MADASGPDASGAASPATDVAGIVDGLNPAQREAALHGEGPLLIDAGAGTGKTKTVTHLAAVKIARGVPPERVLLLTFTRRAAEEMMRRAKALSGGLGEPSGGTFHSHALHLLRRFGPRAGLPQEFTVLDPADQGDVMKLARDALPRPDGLARAPAPASLVGIHSLSRNREIPLADAVSERAPDLLAFRDWLADVFAAYERKKRSLAAMDYDDLLFVLDKLLEASPDVRRAVQGLYDVVIVDEYQDTNPVQARIALRLVREGGTLVVVGDAAQSIYRFRGASVENILAFPRAAGGARVVTLDWNYRSSNEILRVANAVLERSRQVAPKRLASDRSGARPRFVSFTTAYAEADFVAGEIASLLEEGNVPPREIGVLFRSSQHSFEVEQLLRERGILFEKWGGLELLELAHVKDVLAYPRVVTNPRDELAWSRLLLKIPKVGPKAVERLMPALAARGELDLSALPPAARGEVRDLVAFLAGTDWTGLPVAEALERFVGRYRPSLRFLFPEDHSRRERDLSVLLEVAAPYRSLARFVNEVSLDPPEDPSRRPRNAAGAQENVILSTVHSAKGREWRHVYVLRAAEGSFPSARSAAPDEMEEERRLFYVAVTRAKAGLTVTACADGGGTWGRLAGRGDPSRFVQEALLAGALDAEVRSAPPSTVGFTRADRWV